MWQKIQQLKTLYRYINSDNLGDFAILKSDLLGATIEPTVLTQMEAVEGYHPPIDLEKLHQYPDDSFGRQYAEHMFKNNLKPLNISSELAAIAKRNVFALRYVVTHDIFHVLLGFNTSFAGEIGVLAFATAQIYSKSLKISLGMAKFIYPILAPKQTKAIFHNLREGEAIGKQARFLLAYRFEEHWQEPINEVRQKLGLPTILLPQQIENNTINQVELA